MKPDVQLPHSTRSLVSSLCVYCSFCCFLLIPPKPVDADVFKWRIKLLFSGSWLFIHFNDWRLYFIYIYYLFIFTGDLFYYPAQQLGLRRRQLSASKNARMYKKKLTQVENEKVRARNAAQQHGNAMCHSSRRSRGRGKFWSLLDNTFIFREAIFAGRWAWQGVGSVMGGN